MTTSDTEKEWDEQVRAEAQAQWGHDPAGSSHAGDAELGTPESFRNVERQRYIEQPWMHRTFRYERYSGQRVLEIGVGLGTDHLQFARAGAKTTGIDLTPRCIELTAERIEQEGLESDLRVMDAERLEFEDDSFDAVYSFGVLHHVPSTERAFQEVRRVLKPGGVFLGGLYSRESYFHAYIVLNWALRGRFLHQPYESLLADVEYSTSDARPLVRLFGKEELRAILLETGFSDVTMNRRHVGIASLTDRLPTSVDWRLGQIGGWYVVHHAR